MDLGLAGGRSDLKAAAGHAGKGSGDSRRGCARDRLYAEDELCPLIERPKREKEN